MAAIIHQLNDYNRWLFEECVANSIWKSNFKDTSLNPKEIEEMVQLQPKSHAVFWRLLFGTQQFITHAETMKREFSEHSHSMNKLFSRLDELLDEANTEKSTIATQIEKLQMQLEDCNDRIETLQFAKTKIINELSCPPSSSSPPTAPFSPPSTKRQVAIETDSLGGRVFQSSHEVLEEQSEAPSTLHKRNRSWFGIRAFNFNNLMDATSQFPTAPSSSLAGSKSM